MLLKNLLFLFKLCLVCFMIEWVIICFTFIDLFYQVSMLEYAYSHLIFTTVTLYPRFNCWIINAVFKIINLYFKIKTCLCVFYLHEGKIQRRYSIKEVSTQKTFKKFSKCFRLNLLNLIYFWYPCTLVINCWAIHSIL